MPKAHIALIATAALVLVCIPFAFWAAKPSTLHFIQAQPAGDDVLVSFALHNPPSRYLGLSLVRLEVMGSSGWEEAPYGVAGYTQSTDVEPHAEPVLRFVITKVAGKRLRLVAQAQREGNGFVSFAARWKAWSFGKSGSSLKLFDRLQAMIRTDPAEIVSEEFVEK